MNALPLRYWLLALCCATAFALLWWWTLGRPRARRRQQLLHELAGFDADVAYPAASALPAGLADRPASDALHPWMLFIGDAAANVPGLLALDMRAEQFWQLRQLPHMAAIALGATAVCDAAEPRPRSLWFRALLTLVDHRPALPLNGIVVCVDAQCLLSSTSQSLDLLTQRLQRMLDETTRLLRLRLPAYVLITGLEKLRGYAEVAGALPSEVRSQAIGHRLPEHDAGKVPIAERFDALYPPLMDRLLALGAALLREKTDPASRLEIQHWIEQLADLQPRLRALIGALFELSDAARWRGLYLTAAPSASTGGEGAFTTDLLNRLLPADRPLARPLAGRR